MNELSLVHPMFAMVLLTAAVLATLFRARVKAVADGKIRPSYFKTYQGEVESGSTIKLSRHFTNIFEAPTLFYVACLAAMVTGQSSPIIHVLAWIYVLLRFVHAYIHIGKNKLRPRIFAYFLSWIALMAMWVQIVVGVSSF